MAGDDSEGQTSRCVVRRCTAIVRRGWSDRAQGWVPGWVRIHHGLVGEAVILAAALPLALAARAGLVALGAALLWDDRHDWPFPIRDRIG